MSFAMVANAQRYDWSTWLMGIFRSVIQGGAAAVVSGFSVNLIAPNTFNLTPGDGLGKTLTLMTTMFVIQGIIHMFMFLQTHPAPEVVTTKFTETDTTKVGTGDQATMVVHQSTAESTTVKPPDSPK